MSCLKSDQSDELRTPDVVADAHELNISQSSDGEQFVSCIQSDSRSSSPPAYLAERLTYHIDNLSKSQPIPDLFPLIVRGQTANSPAKLSRPNENPLLPRDPINFDPPQSSRTQFPRTRQQGEIKEGYRYFDELAAEARRERLEKGRAQRRPAVLPVRPANSEASSDDSVQIRPTSPEEPNPQSHNRELGQNEPLILNDFLEAQQPFIVQPPVFFSTKPRRHASPSCTRSAAELRSR